LKFTYRQLQVFACVAQNGSFTAAAKVLQLTQPTLSIQVKQLAEAVGVPLYTQHGKRIVITLAGKALLEHYLETAASYHRLEARLREMEGVEQGVLRIAAGKTAEYLLPKLVAWFAERHPAIDIRLFFGERTQVLERLANNSDDVYLLSRPPFERAIQVEPFLSNPVVIVAPRFHGRVKDKRLTLEQLAHEPFIVREGNSDTRLMLDEFVVAQHLRLRYTHELSSNEAIKQAVAAGMGLGIISRYALQGSAELSELVELDVLGFPLLANWCAVYSRSHPLSAAGRSFIDFLHEEAAQRFEPVTQLQPE
jgi:DNA-binding transcriptional LysR family regulator